MKQVLGLITAALLITLTPALAGAHCQIPCGIYDDELRVQLIEEHITTVEKSMKKVTELAAAEAPDFNQLTRWVMNKEAHAGEIQEIVTAYFMSQRIKAAAGEGEEWSKYVNKLTLLHGIQVTAMKAKQSTDLAHIETLRELVAKFRVAYFGKDAGHSH
jgi:nickel superoxide dismutase